jgi:hypothetical protein
MPAVRGDGLGRTPGRVADHQHAVLEDLRVVCPELREQGLREDHRVRIDHRLGR